MNPKSQLLRQKSQRASREAQLRYQEKQRAWALPGMILTLAFALMAVGLLAIVLHDAW